jgi:hypothetical protein
MAELDVGIGRDVRLDLLPVDLVVAVFFEVSADGQEPLVVLDPGKGLGQFADTPGQALLQLHHANGGIEAGPQLVAIEGGW